MNEYQDFDPIDPKLAETLGVSRATSRTIGYLNLEQAQAGVKPEWSNGRRCDHCGAWCVDQCLRCGAPQCCPKCCKEDYLQTELDKAQAALGVAQEHNIKLQDEYDEAAYEARELWGAIEGRDQSLVALGEAVRWLTTGIKWWGNLEDEEGVPVEILADYKAMKAFLSSSPAQAAQRLLEERGKMRAVVEAARRESKTHVYDDGSHCNCGICLALAVLDAREEDKPE